MESNEGAWKPLGNSWELLGGQISARVDVSRPEQGLRDVRLSGRPLVGQLYCVSRFKESAAGHPANHEAGPVWPLPVADAYCRGGDLVATYKPSEDWPYSPQIYWRAIPTQSVEGAATSLSLLVSVQTHLLDTWPRIVVESLLNCSEVLHVSTGNSNHAHGETLAGDVRIEPSAGDCCIVRRLADEQTSYVEIMPASDFRQVAVRHENGKCRVSWELFAEFLEKGVIRRSRLYSAFIPTAGDVEHAATCCEAIAQSELPLTT